MVNMNLLAAWACLSLGSSVGLRSSGGQRSSPLSTSPLSVGSTTMDGKRLESFGNRSWASGNICNTGVTRGHSTWQLSELKCILKSESSQNALTAFKKQHDLTFTSSIKDLRTSLNHTFGSSSFNFSILPHRTLFDLCLTQKRKEKNNISLYIHDMFYLCLEIFTGKQNKNAN